MKVYADLKACIKTFIAALFVIVRSRASEWVNKLLYPNNGMIFSTKRNKLLIPTTHG